MNLLIPVVLAFGGLGCVAVGTIVLRRGAMEQGLGELVAVDAGRPATLRSERYHLVGRPDAIRRRPDGALVPVELKHRSAPRHGPFPSHLLQLAAYCLLVEDAAGRSPPFGVLRYLDREVVVPFTAQLRSQVLAVLTEATGPYDGRADPSVAKCERCRWSRSCDVSWARGR